MTFRLWRCFFFALIVIKELEPDYFGNKTFSFFLELYHYDETQQFNEYPQIIIGVQTIQQDSWKLVVIMMTR